MFKRRHTPALWIRIREFLWPRKGWRRGFQYVGLRVQRLRDSAHNIALGFACGAFVSFTPLFGLHFFLAAFCAWVMRANVVASLFGTIIGNPITFPAIAMTSVSVGTRLLGRQGEEPPAFERLMDAFGHTASAVLRWAAGHLDGGAGGMVSDDALRHQLSNLWHGVLLPYLAGGVIPGLLFAMLCYFILRPVIAAYQKRRGELLASRLKAQAARRLAEHAARRGRHI